MKFGKLPLREEVFMDGRKIFDAINTCDDVFIKEVVLDMKTEGKSRIDSRDYSLIRISICQEFVLQRQLFFLL